MSAFLKLLYIRLRSYFPLMYAALFFVLAAAISYYVYSKMYLPSQQNKAFQDVANTSANGRTIVIYFFHVDWCPHCKRALPEWQTFSDQHDGTTVNGFKIECKDVDCTNDKDPNIKSVINQYSVSQYPTVIAVMPGPDGKELRVDFEAKVNKQNLEKFVNSAALESGM